MSTHFGEVTLTSNAATLAATSIASDSHRWEAIKAAGIVAGIPNMFGISSITAYWLNDLIEDLVECYVNGDTLGDALVIERAHESLPVNTFHLLALLLDSSLYTGEMSPYGDTFEQRARETLGEHASAAAYFIAARIDDGVTV